jgi:hypothetical protein
VNNMKKIGFTKSGDVQQYTDTIASIKDREVRLATDALISLAETKKLNLTICIIENEVPLTAGFGDPSTLGQVNTVWRETTTHAKTTAA